MYSGKRRLTTKKLPNDVTTRLFQNCLRSSGRKDSSRTASEWFAFKLSSPKESPSSVHGTNDLSHLLGTQWTREKERDNGSRWSAYPSSCWGVFFGRCLRRWLTRITERKEDDYPGQPRRLIDELLSKRPKLVWRQRAYTKKRFNINSARKVSCPHIVFLWWQPRWVKKRSILSSPPHEAYVAASRSRERQKHEKGTADAFVSAQHGEKEEKEKEREKSHKRISKMETGDFQAQDSLKFCFFFFGGKEDTQFIIPSLSLVPLFSFFSPAADK